MAYGIDKKLHKSEVCTVSPRELLLSGGFYMLLCVPEDACDIKAYRIDMMTKVAGTDDAADEVNKADAHDIDMYVEGHPYLGVGRVETVKIELYEDAIGRAIDTFGRGVDVNFAEDDDKVIVTFRANTEDVYLWALQNADVAAVLSPQSLRDRLRRTSGAMNNAYLRYGADHENAAFDAITGNVKNPLAKHFNKQKLLTSKVQIRNRLMEEGKQDTVTHIVINRFSPRVREEMKDYVNVRKIEIPQFNEDYDDEQLMTDLDFLSPLENIEHLSVWRDELTDISAVFGMGWYDIAAGREDTPNADDYRALAARG